jgi:heme A synthase
MAYVVDRIHKLASWFAAGKFYYAYIYSVLGYYFLTELWATIFDYKGENELASIFAIAVTALSVVMGVVLFVDETIGNVPAKAEPVDRIELSMVTIFSAAILAVKIKKYIDTRNDKSERMKKVPLSQSAGILASYLVLTLVIAISVRVK